MTENVGVAARPAYTLSKMAGTLLFQVIAQNTPSSKVQIINFHPGLIYNDTWGELGLSEDNFDSSKWTYSFHLMLPRGLCRLLERHNFENELN